MEECGFSKVAPKRVFLEEKKLRKMFYIHIHILLKGFNINPSHKKCRYMVYVHKHLNNYNVWVNYM